VGEKKKNATSTLINLAQRIDFKTRSNHNKKVHRPPMQPSTKHTHTHRERERVNPPLWGNQIPHDEKVIEIGQCSLRL